MPEPNPKQSQKIKKADRVRVILSIIAVVFSLTCIFVIFILAKIYPAPINRYDPETGIWIMGMKNFLLHHDIRGFYKFCWVLLSAGVLGLALGGMRGIRKRITKK